MGVRYVNIDIGSKIKNIRIKKNLSIAQLAKKSDLSPGLISQIERNSVNPSIASLWKLANGLDISIGSLFDEEEKHKTNPIVRKNERKRILTSDSNATYELLSPDLNRKIEFLYIRIKPNDCTNKELVTHEGEECGIVLRGRLMVKTAKGDFILEEGDSICFDSTIPHRYINLGDEECISIWAMTPPSF